MPQSSVIFFFIAAAFLVFITQRGELRTYLGFLYGTAPAPASSSTTSTSSTWTNWFKQFLPGTSGTTGFPAVLGGAAAGG